MTVEKSWGQLFYFATINLTFQQGKNNVESNGVKASS